MKQIEELSINAFPSLQTILYDGWIIRFADGYGNRSNSINPIYESKIDVDEKILYCENLFESRGLETVFKITPFINPLNLDSILENKGYKKLRETSVQLVDLNLIGKPSFKEIKSFYELDDLWYEKYFLVDENFDEDRKRIHRKILENIVEKKVYVFLIKNNKPIACGLGVVKKDIMGVFDIRVSKKNRKKGYGTQLMLNILEKGKELGVNKAYLQVMCNNSPALGLYNKLCFKEIYRYYFRKNIKK